jgi:competence ComEA-like helix-hairpin-helix protein
VTRRITDSLSVNPLHGLIILGLVTVLGDLLVSGPGSAWQRPDVIPENCVYEVYQDDRSVGTVFLKHAENLPEILSKLGAKPSSREDCGRIPCNRAIRLSSTNAPVFVGKIQGSHLIAAGKRVDVNLADARDLEAVPGIGPQLAQRIIAVRDSKGGFMSVDDLRQVQGIGHKRLSDMIQHIEISSSDIGGDEKGTKPSSEFLSQ